MTVPSIAHHRLPVDDDNELLDIRAIARVVHKRRKWIAIVCATTILLTTIAYLLTKPRYVAAASMVVERQADEVIPVESDTPVLATDSPTVDTVVQILKSPVIAGRVVDALKLTDQPEFNPDLGNPDAAAQSRTAARERAIRILGGSLGVKREGISYAIGVQYTSRNPETAAAVANAVIDQYLANNIESEARTTRQGAQQLETRLEELRGEVLAAEAEVARYRAEQGLFAVSDVSSITQQELSVLNTQLAEAKALEAAANARLSASRSQNARGMSADSLNEALRSEVVTGLRTQRAQLSAEVADASSRYGPLHPNYIKTREQLEDIDRQINAEVNRVVASLISEARVAQGRTGSIAASLGGIERRLATDTKASVRLSELERNAQSARELYQSLLDEYKKNVARQGTENSGAKSISRAAVPVVPVSPNPLLFAAIAAVAALGLSALVVAATEFFQRGIQTTGGIEKKLNIRALVSMPELGSLPGSSGSGFSPPDFLLEHPDSQFAEAVRALRTSLIAVTGRANMQVLCVASALPGEGKTTTAMCLARSAAQAGISTIVVDCNSRGHALLPALSGQAQFGVSDILQGRCSLDQAIVKDSQSGASFLAQASDHNNSRDLMASEEMAALIERLRERFSLVILDTAPMLSAAEAGGIAALADGVVFLVQWEKTPAKAARIALSQLQALGANVTGVSLSRVDVARQSKLGFNDAGDYSGQFRQSYA
jgi:polysaccharide biosynthesis transport protein